jgi:hypothetical protein
MRDAQPGRDLAEALAAKDSERLAAVLDPDVDFRGLTPRQAWEASSAEEFVAIAFQRWFEDKDEIDELVSVDDGTVGDRERVAYLIRGHNPDGPFVVEQQAYYETDNGRITWLRVLCSGFRPEP